MVVTEVSTIARSRSRTPPTIASKGGSRSARRPMVVTRMIELLTTMPDSPMSATRLRMVRL